MKVRRTIFFAVFTGFIGFGCINCSKMSNGILPAPTANKFLNGADGPPLWLVDNVEVANPYEKGSVKKVSPTDIYSITVFSPASYSDLVSRYGPKGKNGVVLVATKNAVN